MAQRANPALTALVDQARAATREAAGAFLAAAAGADRVEYVPVAGGRAVMLARLAQRIDAGATATCRHVRAGRPVPLTWLACAPGAVRPPIHRPRWTVDRDPVPAALPRGAGRALPRPRPADGSAVGRCAPAGHRVLAAARRRRAAGWVDGGAAGVPRVRAVGGCGARSGRGGAAQPGGGDWPVYVRLAGLAG